MNIHQYIRKNCKVTFYKGKKSQRILNGVSRGDMYGMFSELGLKKAVEVGVARGRNAWLMYQTVTDLDLTLVEPYEDHSIVRERWGEDVHRRFKEQAILRLAKYKPKWIFGFSEDVFNQVPDRSIDWVYIDGMHTYNFVMLDIILWSRKVKKGGIVSGHDYEYYRPNSPRVARAINNFASAYKLYPIYITDKDKIDPRTKKKDKFASWFWENK